MSFVYESVKNQKGQLWEAASGHCSATSLLEVSRKTQTPGVFCTLWVEEILLQYPCIWPAPCPNKEQQEQVAATEQHFQSTFIRQTPSITFPVTAYARTRKSRVSCHSGNHSSSWLPFCLGNTTTLPTLQLVVPHDYLLGSSCTLETHTVSKISNNIF